jgi:hypothetical protein
VWVPVDGIHVTGTVLQHAVDGDESKCVVEVEGGEKLTALRSDILQREPLEPGGGVDQLTTLRCTPRLLPPCSCPPLTNRVV